MSDVYARIASVSGEIAKIGMAKNRKNIQQGYDFRGIDDVYNMLAPMLASHGLVILPRILTRVVTERPTAKGGVQFNVVVEAEFDFVAASDGSEHTVRTFGEAMDSGDKATNKAMSAAYKYAAFQTFCIPTEGDNDADATTPEATVADVKAVADELERAFTGVAAKANAAAQGAEIIAAIKAAPDAAPRPPNGFEAWIVALESVADDGIEPLRDAWKASPANYRKYVNAHLKDQWDALKQVAENVTARTAMVQA